MPETTIRYRVKAADWEAEVVVEGGRIIAADDPLELYIEDPWAKLQGDLGKLNAGVEEIKPPGPPPKKTDELLKGMTIDKDLDPKLADAVRRIVREELVRMRAEELTRRAPPRLRSAAAAAHEEHLRREHEEYERLRYEYEKMKSERAREMMMAMPMAPPTFVIDPTLTAEDFVFPESVNRSMEKRTVRKLAAKATDHLLDAVAPVVQRKVGR